MGMRVSSFAARPGLGCVINYEAAYLVIVVALARHGRQRSHCYLVPIYILVGATNDQRHCGMALASDLLSCILTVGLYFFAVWASSKVRDCFLSLRTTRSTHDAEARLTSRWQQSRPRSRECRPRAPACIALASPNRAVGDDILPKSRSTSQE